MVHIITQITNYKDLNNIQVSHHNYIIKLDPDLSYHDILKLL